MCLILVAWRPGTPEPLLVLANRDEFLDRPTAPLAPWPELPGVYAGRDLEAGGSWFAASEDGRFAAVTNYRDPRRVVAGAPSRGALVVDFLAGQQPGAAFVDALSRAPDDHNGFNLLLADAGGLHYYSNRGGPPRRLRPGIYGLCNHLLDTPWPKVVRARSALTALLAAGLDRDAELFALMADTHQPAAHQLPDTGVGGAWERQLAPIFIRAQGYGTRCTTLLRVGAGGEVTLRERSHDDGSDRAFHFRWRGGLLAASAANA